MTDASYFREKAEQALRIARSCTDATLIKNLEEFAQENVAKAEMIEAGAWKERERDD